MSLIAVDGLVFVATFVVTAIAAWRSWRHGLVTGLLSIWLGLVLWGGLLSARDPDHNGSAVDGVWLLTGWIVPIVFVGSITAVRRTIDAGRHRRASPDSQAVGTPSPEKPTR